MSDKTFNIVHPDIQHYLLDVTPDRDPVLQEMDAYAAEKNFPIIGPLVGRMLALLARAIDAQRILELGSGFGYSAYWFAKGTSPECRIVCTDASQNNAERGLRWLERGGFRDKIEYRIGDALDIAEQIEGEFDLILNDIDKEDYPRALPLCIPKLRAGGLLITDNVLWSGRILNAEPDAATAAIITYTRMLFSSPSLFTTIIPLRDGVSVSIKL